MTPQTFLSKWRDVELKERTASQSHFNDLCQLLDVEDPISADPKGQWFTFEKGATKTSGGEGWADVWRKGFFAWEYKGRHANLDKAYNQLLQYAVALENPPLLIVSDMNRIIIRTNWTNTVQTKHEFELEDLIDGAIRDRLKAIFIDPEAFKPSKSRQELTEEAAAEFASLAQQLRNRGHEAHEVAHFIIRLVFCMFAERVGLLPDNLFTKMIDVSRRNPDEFTQNARTLFSAMAYRGGKVGFTPVDWFNGGLFDSNHVLPVTSDDIDKLWQAASLDWSQIDPSILGTLFERGLDPAKRSQLGAHYTDHEKIMMIVGPTIIEPLESEWKKTLARITKLIENAPRQTAEKLLRGTELAKRTRAISEAGALHSEFIERLANFRVLDPACGSGNFLYVALKSLKDVEHRANLDAEVVGIHRGIPRVGPRCVLGIELNPYAAELARVSVWIGEIQWMRQNGFKISGNPILESLDTIQCRDAILNEDGSETNWPHADVIVGNPPFLGAKRMKGRLGTEETERLRSAFSDRLSGFTDLVCYWFEKAREAVESGNTTRVGLVATKSIAKNTNLPVLYRISGTAQIFNAWANEPWIVDGAAVRVAIVCFGRSDHVHDLHLNGAPVDRINPDLTFGLNISAAIPLKENKSVGFVGVQKSGPFDVSGDLARRWLAMPRNPNGRPNSDVLKPTWNGRDITTSRRDVWFIDFPRGLTEAEASLWQAPFNYLASAAYDPDDKESPLLREARSTARDIHPRRQWWTTYWPRPEVRAALNGLRRYITTPMTSEHRIFLWLQLPTLPDNNLVIVARDDDVHFGILHSYFHEVWSSRIGNKMGAGNQRRYNRETVYDTFPFPEGLTPDIPADDYTDNPRAQAIASSAAHLNKLRENWLNPPELVKYVPEVVSGYPDRILPVSPEAERQLKKRTLTNLYNARPAWLEHSHRALDEAVAEAYGWGNDYRSGALTDDEILARLFALNQKRSGLQQ
ncbi:MAG: class I SAM-dependent DNA methyltransferase [Aquamicrobium sp.]|uniref:class I SAM-dependent DNA methyltransferase n=1 Tax=Aquamicrobium sp. TaxID=1872579 RepID=UPI00349F00C7|nr:class I SAM-dependent DNA methyltransferase [Aquamicrobium sp.]